MPSLNILRSHSSVALSFEELMEDLNTIVAAKATLDPSLATVTEVTETVFDYADDFNYLSFTFVPLEDAVNLHIEFGIRGGDERFQSGGAVLNWALKNNAVVDCELLHIRGNAISLAVFIEELNKHIGLPAVA